MDWFGFGLRATAIPVNGTVEYIGVDLFAMCWIRRCAVVAIITRTTRAYRVNRITGVTFIFLLALCVVSDYYHIIFSSD